jgi:hypothetical protein
MFANILTKPVQGAQFERERLGLTNWGLESLGVECYEIFCRVDRSR